MIATRNAWSRPGPRFVWCLGVVAMLLCVRVSAGDEPAPAPPETELADSDPALDVLSLSLEELGTLVVPTVEGASRHEQSVSRAPAFVSVIGADEIRAHGKRDISSILDGVAGLYTRYDRNFSYVGVRGFGQPGDYNTHLLVLIDGHRVNDNVAHGVLLGSGFLLDVDAIDRIEVIRGPGSSLYGSSAILGVVNIVTRDGADDSGARVSGTLAGLGTAGGGYRYGRRFADGTDLAVGGSYQASDGQRRLYFAEFDDPATNNGLALDSDADSWGNLHGRLSRGAWTLSGAWALRRKTIPTATFGTYFNDARTGTEDERGHLTLEHRTTLDGAGSARTALSWDMARATGDYVYDYAEPGAEPDLVLNVDRVRESSFTAEFGIERVVHRRHLLTAGVEVVDILAADQSNRDVEPAATYLDDHRAGWNYAAFAQDEFEFRRGFVLDLGLRFDRSYLSGTAFSPRIGLIVSPEAGRSAKLLFGSAFRAPSPSELFYQDGGLSQIPNPDLEPERMRTSELILEHPLGRHLRGTLSLYHFRVRNLISEINTEPGIIQLVNQGTVRTTGLDLEFEGRWPLGVSTRCGYSYANARDGVTGERLVNAPEHLGKLGVIVPLPARGWRIGIGGRASAGVKTLAGDTLPAHAVVDVTLSGRNVLGRLEPALSVVNVGDSRHRVPGGPENIQDALVVDGRVFRFRLTAAF